MDSKEFNKTPLFLEVLYKGKITFNSYYETLDFILKNHPEYKYLFIKAKILDKEQKKLLPREKVSNSHYDFITKSIEFDIITKNAIEIGYIQK